MKIPNEYYKAIAKAIRNQAGLLANFIEENPKRTKKDELYANIFLCFTGIIGAVLHLDMPAKEFSDIMCRLFCDKTGFELMDKLMEWESGK